MKKYAENMENMKEYAEICGKYEAIPPAIYTLGLGRIPISPSIQAFGLGQIN